MFTCPYSVSPSQVNLCYHVNKGSIWWLEPDQYMRSSVLSSDFGFLWRYINVCDGNIKHSASGIHVCLPNLRDPCGISADKMLWEIFFSKLFVLVPASKSRIGQTPVFISFAFATQIGGFSRQTVSMYCALQRLTRSCIASPISQMSMMRRGDRNGTSWTSRLITAEWDSQTPCGNSPLSTDATRSASRCAVLS